ncbi:MAG TPA: DeoR/GlpR family DNA-binding transcription regulator [Devosiaceae bacterium]|nr:DeoR/GlpR family DNA-binding transcription regulator [Devosiaceae bacterium]
MTERSRSSLRGKSGAPIGAARQQSILSLIARGDVISVGDFAERFGVSQETIRRDIRSLEEAGQLRRVHGGAAPMRTIDLTARRPVSERLDVDRDAKILAARAALPLFEDEMNVFIGASSTMLLLAEELARSSKSLTVTTNMIDIALLLSGAPGFTVTLLGGHVNPATRAVGGYETFRALEQRLFDLSVLGCSALSTVHGFLGPTRAHAEFDSMVKSRSHRFAFAMDSAKFGRSDAHIVLPLRDVDAVATDSEPSSDFQTALAEAGVDLLLPPLSTGAPEK